MFIESLEKYPEELHGEFVETEFEGKKGFRHKTDDALFNSLKHAKTEREKYRTEAEEAKGKLTELEQARLQAEQDKKANDLEKAKQSGDNPETIRRLEEQLEDMKRKHGETEAQHKERVDKLTGTIKSEKRTAIVADISSKFANDKGSKRFKQIIASMIDVDPDTGKETYLDEDGKATSETRAQFEERIAKDDSLWGLMKPEVVTSGGGKANGSGAGSASNVTNPKAEEARKKGDLAGFLKAHF